MNNLFGSVYGTPKTWEGERLTAASAMGIPQVVAPGGLDQAAMGPLHTVAPEYLDDVRTSGVGRTGAAGCPISTTTRSTILLPTLEEVEQVSPGDRAEAQPTRADRRHSSSRCAAGPPTTRARSWRHWSEAGPGQRGRADVAARSVASGLVAARHAHAVRAVSEHLDAANPNLDLLACDMHILDPEFADLLNTCMGDMLDSRWTRAWTETCTAWSLDSAGER